MCCVVYTQDQPCLIAFESALKPDLVCQISLGLTTRQQYRESTHATDTSRRVAERRAPPLLLVGQINHAVNLRNDARSSPSRDSPPHTCAPGISLILRTYQPPPGPLVQNKCILDGLRNTNSTLGNSPHDGCRGSDAPGRNVPAFLLSSQTTLSTGVGFGKSAFSR